MAAEDSELLGHLPMLRYFWQTYNDIERYVNYEDIVEAYRKKYPEIIETWEQYKRSEKALDNIFKRIEG